MTNLRGIVGTVIGGFLAAAFLHVKVPMGISVATIVVSVIGAIIAVLAANLVLGTGRRRGTV